MPSPFRALRIRNYRLWATGALISNIGTWMQRIAQDWIVLTELTPHNATAVGIVMSLQFGPQMLLLPVTGWAADHFDRRKLVIMTQTVMGLLALGLGILTITGLVTLWEVYGFALALGCVSAFDAPTRQAFVSDLVGEADLANAVGLNSTSFNGARMIGPAIAGVLIGIVGAGWVFIINALTFVAVLVSLAMIRLSGHPEAKPKDLARPGFSDGFRYVSQRRDLQVVLAMLFLIGTFGLNFPIYISTMSVSVFHAGASEYGLLTSTMAIGSVTGAFLSARRIRPDIPLLVLATGVFGVGCAIAAVMPNYILFGLVLLGVGIFTQTFTTSSNSYVQLSTDPAMRGRVLAILMAIFAGGTPLGAPIVGWVADRFGPRWSLGVGSAAGIVSTLIGLWYLARQSGTPLDESPGG
ncbi:MAG TPA: MFS transporter [Gemmatimonadaceae bacterium]